MPFRLHKDVKLHASRVAFARLNVTNNGLPAQYAVMVAKSANT